MKKIIAIAIIGALFFSCQKNGTESKPEPGVPKIQVKASNVSVDSSATSVDSSVTRPRLAVNTITCANSNVVVAHKDPSTYTLIARFPYSTAYPNVSLPQGIWHAGSYSLNNQSDGNLVVYNGQTQALWVSQGTWNKNPVFKLQTDLNMVAYSGSTPLWGTKTDAYRCTNHSQPANLPRNMMLILTNDGDLEIIADGINGWGILSTIVLAGTRTYGGQMSPNNGTFYVDHSTGGSQTGVDFIW